MAQRTQKLCQIIIDSYGGDAAGVWTTAADGRQLLKQVAALPGFGMQKAKIFVALLGKQLGVTPPGWREACEPFGEDGSYRSVADIVSPASRIKVRDFKKADEGRCQGVSKGTAPERASDPMAADPSAAGRLPRRPRRARPVPPLPVRRHHQQRFSPPRPAARGQGCRFLTHGLRWTSHGLSLSGHATVGNSLCSTVAGGVTDRAIGITCLVYVSLLVESSLLAERWWRSRPARRSRRTRARPRWPCPTAVQRQQASTPSPSS